VQYYKVQARLALIEKQFNVAEALVPF